MLRKGTWTQEEHQYATREIQDFKDGILSITPGTSLRSYLAKQLNCNSMRITKKYSKTENIGKINYINAEPNRFPPVLRTISANKRMILRYKFIISTIPNDNNDFHLFSNFIIETWYIHYQLHQSNIIS